MAGNNPKLSIITVCFNAEQFLERTIESIVSQTYPHLEYILVDGGSTDGTLSVIKKYERHIGRWHSEPDQGLYDAMNKGMRMATGDYLWFMNAGDRIYGPQTVKQIFRDSHNEDFIYGNVVRIDENGNERKWHKPIPPQGKLTARSFINGMVICHQSMIVKKSLAPEFNLKWKIANDIDWSIRVLKQCRTTLFLNIPFCYFLEGGYSARNRWLAVTERFHITREHFGLLPALMQQFKIAGQVIKRGSLS
ncbi:MAG: glycosyl transferase [Chitinophagales bacterium]|nr:MAG: glycosyl transferase [Chitinophagales bacterium]